MSNFQWRFPISMSSRRRKIKIFKTKLSILPDLLLIHTIYPITRARSLKIILDPFTLIQSTKFSPSPTLSPSSLSGLLKHSLTDLPALRIALLKSILYSAAKMIYQKGISGLQCHHRDCFNDTLTAIECFRLYLFISN